MKKITLVCSILFITCLAFSETSPEEHAKKYFPRYTTSIETSSIVTVQDCIQSCDSFYKEDFTKSFSGRGVIDHYYEKLLRQIMAEYNLFVARLPGINYYQDREKYTAALKEMIRQEYCRLTKKELADCIIKEGRVVACKSWIKSLIGIEDCKKTCAMAIEDKCQSSQE